MLSKVSADKVFMHFSKDVVSFCGHHRGSAPDSAPEPCWKTSVPQTS